jgi:hypothetical protein
VARVDDRLKDEIKTRLPVSEVVRRHVPGLKRDGKEWKALSPFGAEKTPSFTVNDQKGFFHDFSTGKHGDIFGFEMEITGCSFAEALKTLAELAGVPLESKRPSRKAGARTSALETNGDQPDATMRADNTARRGRGQAAAHEPPVDDAPPNMGEDQPAQAASKGGEYQRALFTALAGTPAAIYQYKDADGIVRYERYRFEFMVAGKRQKFFLPRRVLDGAVIWGLDEQDYHLDQRGEWRRASADKPGANVRHFPRAERLPYRLPELLAAIEQDEVCHLTEGEKDADRLAALGAVATCSEGAWPEEITGYFSRADIVQHADNDVAGRRHVHRVGLAIRHVVKRHRVLEYPELKQGGDVSDFLDMQPKQPLMALYKRISAEARPWAPMRPDSQYGGLTWEEIGRHARSADFVVAQLVVAGEITVIGGESGSGKSFFAVDMACHVATGRDFFGKRVRPGLVLYQAGESAFGVQKRIQAWRQHHGVSEAEKIPLVVLTKKIDLFDRQSRDVAGLVAEIRAWSDYFLDTPITALVIDTLAKASVGAEENSAKDMGIVLDSLDQVRESFPGLAIVIPHHMNAEGKKLRGSTAIKANVEGVIAISMDPDTKVRTCEVQKMKEEESGERFEFELMQVVLGRQDDGEKITSCIVLPRGEKEALRQSGGVSVKEGYRLSDLQRLYFRVLLDVLRRNGRVPPSGLELPTAIREVVPYEQFKDAYWQANPYDGKAGDEKARDKWRKRTRDRLGEIRQVLQTAHVVGVGDVIEHNEAGEAHAVAYIWWTGRPVAGFAETQPPAKKKPAGSNVVPLRPGDGAAPEESDERLPI